MDNKYVNTFIITGTVVTVFEKNSTLLIRLATAPYGHVDYPLVVLYDNERKHLVKRELVKRGQRLTVSGYVLTSAKYPLGSLVVTNVVVEKSRLEVAFDDNEEFVSDQNTIKFKGLMNYQARKINDNTARFAIQTLEPSGRFVYPHCVTFDNNAHRLLQLPANTPIACLCYAQTKRLNRTTTLQSYVAQAIETLS